MSLKKTIVVFLGVVFGLYEVSTPTHAASLCSDHALYIVEGGSSMPEPRASLLKALNEITISHQLAQTYTQVSFVDPAQIESSAINVELRQQCRPDLFVLGHLPMAWWTEASKGLDLGLYFHDSEDELALDPSSHFENHIEHRANSSTEPFFLGRFVECLGMRGEFSSCAQAAVDWTEFSRARISQFGIEESLGAWVRFDQADTVESSWTYEFQKKQLAADHPFSHTSFAEATISFLSGIFLPGAFLDPTQVKDPAALIAVAQPLGQTLLNEAFPKPVASGEPGSWVDGATFRFLVEPAIRYVNMDYRKILDHLVGAEIKRTPIDLVISLYFDQELKIPLNQKHSSRIIGLFLAVPKEVSLHFAMHENEFEMLHLAERNKCFRLEVQFGFFKQWINIRRFGLDLKSGVGSVTAAFFDNRLPVTLRFQARPPTPKPKPAPKDFWQAIQSPEPYLEWSSFKF